MSRSGPAAVVAATSRQAARVRRSFSVERPVVLVEIHRAAPPVAFAALGARTCAQRRVDARRARAAAADRARSARSTGNRIAAYCPLVRRRPADRSSRCAGAAASGAAAAARWPNPRLPPRPTVRWRWERPSRGGVGRARLRRLVDASHPDVDRIGHQPGDGRLARRPPARYLHAIHRRFGRTPRVRLGSCGIEEDSPVPADHQARSLRRRNARVEHDFAADVEVSAEPALRSRSSP